MPWRLKRPMACSVLEAIAAHPVDVVLVDIRMPKMDGVELARHLGQPSCPPAVIFVTAFDGYAVQAFELNAVDYLVKPVRAQRLAAACRRSAGVLIVFRLKDQNK